ncbi:uncharacterized protein L969DRAFT_51661 [Mixia osmundae IAM 14324]|uniref:FYVE-type domain-containing protein n=1 Tax=Mixia osmundae (strain CBS 9802 / IAM 14324 / JCM 22182 / KY 12970) TaxID=764103 RepID=G7DWU6_MIXOS|nr:uncharacterized protein L969DRAFT_97526 [Mixia osmundae IAM 14324]XP_014566711.1 uncharacterized protein L969DRAFT_51661 [Mixia osmundae IAM 14324]KEI36180.1 hypothetical protein L969DRAFT_97526 [Mixia osmundae IAM 14324]KEI38148.1 hypothetical protein L969DRAFT_51661 [Mixia osmundae IAM 14324]GAA95043.1 hypothetical protein E5Q_01698 [Mixia osmundae IAM 14324]
MSAPTTPSKARSGGSGSDSPAFANGASPTVTYKPYVPGQSKRSSLPASSGQSVFGASLGRFQSELSAGSSSRTLGSAYLPTSNATNGALTPVQAGKRPETGPAFLRPAQFETERNESVSLASLGGDAQAFFTSGAKPNKPDSAPNGPHSRSQSVAVQSARSVSPARSSQAVVQAPIARSQSAHQMLATSSLDAPSRSGQSTPRQATPPVARSVSPQKSASVLPVDSARSRETVQVQPDERSHRRTVYRAGFQPNGVYRNRMDELLSSRNAKGEGRKLEESRIVRRLDKLIELHTAPVIPSEPGAPSMPRNGLSFRSLTDLQNLRRKTAGQVWDDVLRGVRGSKDEIKSAEQKIVKWQDDASVQRCPICLASFSLTTRKHHCRTCGRVICFLPPTTPSSLLPPGTPAPLITRSRRCSTFITFEIQPALIQKGQRIIETEVDITGSIVGTRPGEKLHGAPIVRICQDCLSTAMRQQTMSLTTRAPTYLRLYEVLLQLQNEIDSSLPELQEMIMGLQRDSAHLTLGSTANATPVAQRDALAARKSIMSNLASYDSIARRIKDLPLADGGQPGGSQDRIQRAISSRAQLFLHDKMALLKGLNMQDLEGPRRKPRRGNTKADSDNQQTSQQHSARTTDAEVGDRKAVLLEQAQLVETMLADANARRQLEDAAALKTSLNELHASRDQVLVMMAYASVATTSRAKRTYKLRCAF